MKTALPVRLERLMEVSKQGTAETGSTREMGTEAWGIRETDRIEPLRPRGEWRMMQGDQYRVVTVHRERLIKPPERTGRNRARRAPREGRVEKQDAPGAGMDHLRCELGSKTLPHVEGIIMVARDDIPGHIEGSEGARDAPVGLERSAMGEVPGHEQEIGTILLFGKSPEDLPQAGLGCKALIQLTHGILEEMKIRQLDEMNRPLAEIRRFGIFGGGATHGYRSSFRGLYPHSTAARRPGRGILVWSSNGGG